MPFETNRAPSSRTRVRRFHERGCFDAGTIADIIDGSLMCHIAFNHNGSPAIIPTLCWRDGERLYLHGSSASRMIKAIKGKSVCIAVTILDGLVLTRSAFHHSANYRSVVIYGVAHRLDCANEKSHQLRQMMERMFPGRWETLRPVRPQELKATQVMYVTLDEASAKVRTGAPSEEETDLAWPTWGGVVPLETISLTAIPDSACRAGVSPPGLAVIRKFTDVS